MSSHTMYIDDINEAIERLSLTLKRQQAEIDYLYKSLEIHKTHAVVDDEPIIQQSKIRYAGGQVLKKGDL